MTNEQYNRTHLAFVSLSNAYDYLDDQHTRLLPGTLDESFRDHVAEKNLQQSMHMIHERMVALCNEMYP